MTQTQEQVILEAIRDAVKATVAEFGMEFVRTLSMFPSAPVNQELLQEAA